MIDAPSQPLRIKSKSVHRFLGALDAIQAMPLFEKHKHRFQRRDKKNRGKRGFTVEVPPKILLYTIFVFIILPLLLASFFLVRLIFFGSPKEDELHPLHKKQPHLRGHNNGTEVDVPVVVDPALPTHHEMNNITEALLNIDEAEKVDEEDLGDIDIDIATNANIIENPVELKEEVENGTDSGADADVLVGDAQEDKLGTGMEPNTANVNVHAKVDEDEASQLEEPPDLADDEPLR